VSRPLPSSTVITPSLPTLSIASAIILPISVSWLAAQAPTWAISLDDLMGLDIFTSSATIAAQAFSTPRLSCMALAPAVTFLRPSSKTASA